MLNAPYFIRNVVCKLQCSLDLLLKPKVRNGKIALHAMFQNEAAFLKEWLDYHLANGVDYIYLTNDQSTDDWQSVLLPYQEAGLLEVENSIAHPDFYTREEHHKRQIWTKAQKQFEWVAFLDTDEFLYCQKPFLSVLRSAPPKASGVIFNWLVYGTAHKEDLKKDELMLEALNRRFPDGHEEHRLVKSVLRSGSGARFFNKNPHYPNYSPLAPLYWSDGVRFRPNETRSIFDPGHVKHYWYRTEQFFREVKRKRRAFFDGKERSKDLEEWHYERSNAVFDSFPEKPLEALKRFREKMQA